MSEPISGDIQQILTTFDTVLTICENERWVKTILPDDIKITFKMGLFIESTITKLKDKNTLDSFMKMLDNWREFKLGKTEKYPCIYYWKICDHILAKFFKCPTINENVIDIAVRMYTSSLPKERFQDVIKNVIIESASLEAISEFAVTNKNKIDEKDLKFRLILNEWRSNWKQGQSETVKASIQDSVSICKVESCLEDLIGVLSLDGDEDNEIKDLILKILLEKMNDRTILTKEFWLVLFQKVDTSIVSKVSLKNPKFFESFIKFILYVGGMMEYHDSKWVGNPSTSLCPEITYKDLIKVISSLIITSDFMKELILNKLKEADLSIWQEMMATESL